MKFSKKFFVILGLVALLAATLFTTAFAADTRVVKFATVDKVKVLVDQPATFRLLGSYTCDKVQINSSVSGKVITIYAYDVKEKQTGRGCDTATSFSKNFSVGTLVPGTYTILVNPDVNGKPQKKLKGFIAPLMPVTASPLGTPAP
jgi:hypothetical protein